jgi:hypothetical protein
MWRAAASLVMACSGLTVKSGATLALPSPPADAVPASGPMTATDLMRASSSGSVPRSFLSSTVPASARPRAVAPSAAAGMGLCGGAGRSNSPRANMVRVIRLTISSSVALLTWPPSTAVARAGPK